jgi:hypothetical protein
MRLRAFCCLVLTCAPLGATTNRFFNPDFDTHTVGWVDSDGTSMPARSTLDRNGCSRSGSADPSTEPGWGIASASVGQCIPVGSGEVLMAVADVLISGSTDVGVGMSVQFTTGSCTATDGPRIETPLQAGPPNGTWGTLPRMQFGVPPGMQSAVVTFGFVTTGTLDVKVDRAFVGDPFEVLYEDFELGYSCAFDWFP